MESDPAGALEKQPGRVVRRVAIVLVCPGLEAAGVEFINGGQLGVRMKTGKSGTTIATMKSKAGPSHDGQVEAIRDRMAQEDATKTPEKGMEMLRRGRAVNEQRKAAAKKVARKRKPPAEASPRTVIAKGAEARGKAKAAVDEALAHIDVGHVEKAARKRKLTSVPKELKP